uniref:Uncharacterized protein n=1 Tax=Panagrolaimus sp. ES5 TaxID=591445 RepID=A0AC34G091_9BILA
MGNKHSSHSGPFCPGKNHVANSYNKTIWAFVDCDRTVITEYNRQISAQNSGVSGTLSESAKASIVRVAESKGYTKIQPNSHLLFRPGHTETKYVSVFCETIGDISSCFSIGCNDSVIVNGSGYIRKAKMGTIWTEDN